MKHTSILYLGLLGSMLAAFFMFSGGITDANGDSTYIAPTLSNFTLNTAPAAIYARLPFRITAINESHEYDKSACRDVYFTARDLVGKLAITQGSALIDTTDFTFVSETGDDHSGFTGTFADTIVINLPGTYTATVTFYDSNDPGKAKSTSTLTFTVGAGSETPLAAGTYKLMTFAATPAPGSGTPYAYTNNTTTNTVTILQDGHTASMAINLQFGDAVLAAHPYLQQSAYTYNATGEYSIVNSGSGKAFKIEYEDSAYLIFNFTFDGSTLTLNYSNNGTAYVMTFVKQTGA